MINKVVTIFAALIFLFTNSFALLTAEVNGGVIEKPLITVVTDNVVDDFAQSVNTIITQDLNNSGDMDANQDIKYEIKEKKQVPWKNLNSDYVLLVKYVKNASNNYNVEVQIIKRNDMDYIRSISYNNISTVLKRQLAHKIANYAYKAITGEDGFYLTKLAYVKVTNPYSRYGRVYELVISDYDGFDKKIALKLTDNPIATPSWSNDGKYIIYSSYIGGAMGVYSLELATGKVKEVIKQKGINSAAAYSPDDKNIVVALSKGYSDQTNIYIMNLVTRSLKQLTINGINTAPKYSPNGKSVVFVSDRSGRPNMYVTPADSKYPQSSVLTTNVYQAYDPSYTADGKSIVFMYQKARGQGTQIATLKLSNNDIKVLTSGKSDTSPTVSPFGNMAAYMSTKSGGVSSLEMISLDGDAHFIVDEIKDAKTILQSPAWSPKNF